MNTASSRPPVPHASAFCFRWKIVLPSKSSGTSAPKSFCSSNTLLAFEFPSYLNYRSNNRSLRNPERQLLKRHLGQKKRTGAKQSSGIGFARRARAGVPAAAAIKGVWQRQGHLPGTLSAFFTLYIFSGIRYIKTMAPLHYRPIIAASLRADANRRTRSISRRYLSTFHHLDENSGTGSCEPAIKLGSILERYRKDKYVLSRIFSPHCCSNKSLMKWFQKTSISCALLGARFQPKMTLILILLSLSYHFSQFLESTTKRLQERAHSIRLPSCRRH